MKTPKFKEILLLALLVLSPAVAFAGDYVSDPDIGETRPIRSSTAAQRRNFPRIGGSNYSMSSSLRMDLQIEREQRRYEQRLARYNYDLYRKEENDRRSKLRQQRQQLEKIQMQQRQQMARMRAQQQEAEYRHQLELQARQEEREVDEDAKETEVEWKEEEEQVREQNKADSKQSSSWLSDSKSRQSSRSAAGRKPERGFWHAIKRALGVA